MTEYNVNNEVKNFIEENFPVIFAHSKVQSFDFILRKFKKKKKDDRLTDAVLERLSVYSKEDQKEWKLVSHLEAIKGIDLDEVITNKTVVRLLEDLGLNSFLELVVLIETYPYMLFQIKGIGDKLYREIISETYNYIYNLFKEYDYSKNENNDGEDIVGNNLGIVKEESSILKKFIMTIINWFKNLFNKKS